MATLPEVFLRRKIFDSFSPPYHCVVEKAIRHLTMQSLNLLYDWRLPGAVQDCFFAPVGADVE